MTTCAAPIPERVAVPEPVEGREPLSGTAAAFPRPELPEDPRERRRRQLLTDWRAPIARPIRRASRSPAMPGWMAGATSACVPSTAPGCAYRRTCC